MAHKAGWDRLTTIAQQLTVTLPGIAGLSPEEQQARFLHVQIVGVTRGRIETALGISLATGKARHDGCTYHFETQPDRLTITVRA